MKEKVYFIKIKDKEDDRHICRKLKKAIEDKDFFSFIGPKNLVAVKTHFGEEKSIGYVRPLYFSMMGELIKRKGAVPFLTETSTLYSGRRANAVQHIGLAKEHGFTFGETGLPIVMADGLLGNDEIEVDIPGKIYKKVKLAALIVKTQALLMVTHFTGHLVSGFGGALKNMGMGCASRKGKLIQHSTAKPSIKIKACTGCGECLRWCPKDAITLKDKKAVIDKKSCIGCAECLAVCRFDAVGYNWSATFVQLQQKIVEHAMGVAEANKGKTIYFNFLNRITKDCDCVGGPEIIVPDIGVLISYDPVAIDAASLDLVEQTAGKKLSQIAYDIPYKSQIEYARELGFGNPDYELVTL
ncbi:MAG: DUF362 domain-containing protein [Candidatus Aminicenantes bacterium]|nr:DUF362 domain-containing protein [Candidatus Aminicenantes bacterium]